MKKIMLSFSIAFLLLHYNKVAAQYLKIEKISTIFHELKENYAPQKDTNSNSFFVTGYSYHYMSYKVVIKIGERNVYHRSYNDYAKVIVEYMGTDGKYYIDTPSIEHGYEIPAPEEFDKWYSRRDTQIVRTVAPPLIMLLENHKKYRFQIIYPYFTSKDERSKRLLKSDWIYMEFEKG